MGVNNKKAVIKSDNCFAMCDPGEARTLDPMIKSHLLYQLSYGVNRLSISVAKVRIIFELTSVFAIFFQKSAIFLKKRELMKKSVLFGLVVLRRFELRQAEPKTAVLPLHHKTILSNATHRLICDTKVRIIFELANVFACFFEKSGRKRLKRRGLRVRDIFLWG